MTRREREQAMEEKTRQEELQALAAHVAAEFAQWCNMEASFGKHSLQRQAVDPAGVPLLFGEGQAYSLEEGRTLQAMVATRLKKGGLRQSFVTLEPEYTVVHKKLLFVPYTHKTVDRHSLQLMAQW